MCFLSPVWLIMRASETPSSNTSHQNPCPVVRLIIITDESNHRAVINKPFDGVGSLHRHADMGGEEVEERLSTQPCGTPMLSVMVVEQLCPDLTY